MASYKDLKKHYQSLQTRHWMELKEALDTFKSKYGASMEELATGLNVSRQLLYNFMSKPEDGLNKVHRADLLTLWAYLTDPEEYRGKKLSAEHKNLRSQLKDNGSNQFLTSVGFLPEDENEDDYLKIKDPQLKRVILRLESQWVYDDALRAYIVDNILDRVLDQGRLAKDSYIELLDYEKDEAEKSGELSDRKKINNFPLKFDSENPLHKNSENLSETLLKNYRKAILNLAASGKTKYVRSELFELYQSILEHNKTSSKATNRIKVNDCQFETLSSRSILDEIHSFKKLQYEAESDIAFSASNLKSKKSGSLSSVTRVKVRCRFIFFDEQDRRRQKELTFAYGSTGTHVENMIKAMKLGLCHPLEISGFFIRAVGRSDKSLARVAVALSKAEESTEATKIENVYQGWWVTSNTILGILKAFIDAFQRWLHENQKINIIQSKEYYIACQKLSTINILYEKISSYVYEGSFESSRSPGHREIENNIAEIIEVASNFSNTYQNIPYLEEHRIRILTKERRAQLIRLHLFIYEGKLKEAKNIIDDSRSPKNLLKKIHDHKTRHGRRLLLSHARAAFMRYSLTSGNAPFLVGKQWRVDPSFSIQKCLDGIKEHVKVYGNITFASYFCAADFYSSIGLLEFYASDGDAEYLEKSQNCFLKAAHFASRIGYERYSAQFLIYAIRCLCRLDSKKSISSIEELFKKVESIIEKRDFTGNLERGKIAKEKDWLNAIFHICKGEKLHLVEGNKELAIKEFAEALKCSIEIGYIRIMPDCLYNIYRACNDSDIDVSPLQEIRNSLYDWTIVDPDYKDILTGKMGIVPGKEAREITSKEVAENSKSAAIAILNKWARDSSSDTTAKHIFSTKIDKDDFLKAVLNS